jgi:hypothetical protein
MRFCDGCTSNAFKHPPSSWRKFADPKTSTIYRDLPIYKMYNLFLVFLLYFLKGPLGRTKHIRLEIVASARCMLLPKSRIPVMNWRKFADSPIYRDLPIYLFFFLYFLI